MRFGIDQTQKENAWIHHRTTQIIADAVAGEGVSSQLQSAAHLSELQSKAFVADYGLPEKFPSSDTLAEILTSEPLAKAAIETSLHRPDAWEVVDGFVDIGIGIAGLLGGVWGVRIAGVLVDARKKSGALREIILGNELFKYQNHDAVADFKKAHMNQSSVTKNIVAKVKNS